MAQPCRHSTTLIRAKQHEKNSQEISINEVIPHDCCAGPATSPQCLRASSASSFVRRDSRTHLGTVCTSPVRDAHRLGGRSGASSRLQQRGFWPWKLFVALLVYMKDMNKQKFNIDLVVHETLIITVLSSSSMTCHTSWGPRSDCEHFLTLSNKV